MVLNNAALSSVTFTPTVEDLIEVSVINASKISARQWLVVVAVLIVLSLLSLIYILDWWRSGYYAPAKTAAFVVCVSVFAISVRMARRRQILRQSFRRLYSSQKNNGLSVPTTYRLFADYIEIHSNYSVSCSRWTTVERLSYENGYLCFQLGMIWVYVPDRAFASLESARQFHDLAKSLFEKSRAAVGKPLGPCPWSSG